MPPKAPEGKSNPKKKAEELQLLLDRVEKMINKANANIDISKTERNLMLMKDSLSTLESAQELLSSNPIKLPVKEKKKKIQPLQSSIDLIKHDFTQAIEDEEKMRKMEAVQEWTSVEIGQNLNERSIVNNILSSMKEKLKEEYKKRDEELDWRLWISCNHLPDPRSEIDLNDFINDWEKDQATSEFSILAEEVDSSFEVIKQCLQLLASEQLEVCKLTRTKLLMLQENEMKNMLKDLLHGSHLLRVLKRDDDGGSTRTEGLRIHKGMLLEYYQRPEKLLYTQEEGEEERVSFDGRMCKNERIHMLDQNIKRTKVIGLQKLDTMTMEVLLHPQNYMTTEDSRFWEEKKHLALCIWVNLTKNLRLKEIEFPVRNLRISIPQNLIMKSIALRAIFIENFELVHLTSSSSFSKNSLPPEPQLAPQTHLDGLADPPETQLEEGWQRWEEDGMEEVEDAVVGGVVMVQCLNLPREPKKVGTWSMREEVEGGSGKAEEMPYPSIDPYTGQVERLPAISISFLLPTSCIVIDPLNIFISRWDHHKGKWTKDGISDVRVEVVVGDAIGQGREEEDETSTEQRVEIVKETQEEREVKAEEDREEEEEEEERIRQEDQEEVNRKAPEQEEESRRDISYQVSFSTLYLAPLAVMQKRIACFPLKSWRIRPLQQDVSLLSLITHSDWRLNIRVASSGCNFVQPAPPALGHMLGEEMRAMDLLRSLERKGISLMPRDEDYRRIMKDRWHPPLLLPAHPPKEAELEAMVCRDMMMMASTHVMEKSSFNKFASAQQVVVAFRRAEEEVEEMSSTGIEKQEKWTHAMWRKKPFPHCCIGFPLSEEAARAASNEAAARRPLRATPSSNRMLKRRSSVGSMKSLEDKSASSLEVVEPVWRPPPVEFMHTTDSSLSLLASGTDKNVFDRPHLVQPLHADELQSFLLLLRPFSFDMFDAVEIKQDTETSEDNKQENPVIHEGDVNQQNTKENVMENRPSFTTRPKTSKT